MRWRRWLPVVIAVALVAAFARLGLWQLERARQKEAVLAQFAEQSAQPPQALSAWRDLPPYTAVVLRGAVLDSPPIFHDNRIRHGQPGVEVYVPFAPAAGGPAVLVNLGWRAVDQRMTLPPAPIPEVSAMPGLLAPPPTIGVRLGPALTPGDEPPYRVPYLDLAEAAAVLNLTLAPQILLATRADPTWLREWQPVSLPPERHRGYAFQWFALAAAVAALLAWGLRRSWKQIDRDGG